MNLQFNKIYFLLFFLLFFIEILIAIFTFNLFIRGFVGDVLVIILIFSFIKTFLNISSKKVLLATLFFAFGIEFLQYFEITKKLNIQSKLIKTAMGTAFERTDLAAYFLGFLCGWLLEKLFQKKGLKFLKINNLCILQNS